MRTKFQNKTGNDNKKKNLHPNKKPLLTVDTVDWYGCEQTFTCQTLHTIEPSV